MEACMGAEAVVLGDAEIRPVLRSKLFDKHAGQSDTAIIEELGICRGRVRIDVAVVNGALHGYEIKSDRDSLRRLDVQVDFYGKVLDRATLVVGERHLSHALDLLPAWWGVLLIHQTASEPRFKSVRRERKNPRKDPRSLVELLWLEDALALLEARNVARGVRGKPRWFAWDRVCENFSVNEIAAAVRVQLKARAAMQAPA
jgi:diadenosine tetraphosphatase ApaH/serine/threonine PP2A family protein phosphatase